MCIVFIEGAPKITIESTAVRIESRSGGESFKRRMALPDFRTFVADAVQALRDFDASERRRVVPISKGGKPGH